MAYELLDEEPESYLQSGVRNVSRQASNLATRAIGLPGDLMSLVNEYIANPTVKAFGGEEVPYEKTILGKALPTTEQHRENLSYGTGEYLKPKDEVEKFVDDIVEDTALLFSPAGKGTKLSQQAKPLAKSFGKAIGANLAGKVAEENYGKGTGDLAKFGTLFFLSAIDQKKAAQKISELYRTAESTLPENATISASQLEKNLNSLEQKITKGRPIKNLAPSEKFVYDEISNVKDLISNGEINISQAWAQKRSLNEALQKHLFENIGTGKAGTERAKNLAKPITNFLSQTIEQYGKKNPKFYGPFKDAEEAFGVAAKSNFISNFIGKHVGYNPQTQGLLHLFGAGLGKLEAAAVPYVMGKIGYRMSKSPTLRKMYTESLKDIMKEDAKSFTKKLKEMDEELQKEESEDRFEFID